MAAQLPERFGGSRCLCTAILFLLDAGRISRLHRLKSDELWHFYDGEPLDVISIDPSGKRVDHLLGRSRSQGQKLQACVPAGWWFGARVATGSAWSLVGCTVAPGFEFTDFELANRTDLVARLPQHADIIGELTPGGE
jgi:predicted cupin superfamily sugar epimerase